MEQLAVDDFTLIARVREGDLSAFEALYHKYKMRVFQTALAITRDPWASEEILQDCLLRAHRNIDRLDGTLPISPWLHRIAVNLSYNWAARRRPHALPLDEVIEQLIAGPQASPERRMEEREIQHIIHEAIGSLSFKHRAVVVLYHLQGFRLSEIAYILDCPEGTVKSRLHYACKNLRQHLSADHRLSKEVIYEFS